MPEAVSPVPAGARRALHLLVLFSLPVALTVVLPEWVYTNLGALDAWIYNGFFRHTASYTSSLFPGTYYGTRLAWILPGHLAYSVFSPVVANAVLHVTFYCVAVAVVYAIVSELTAASTALFTALAFGLYLPVVRSMGDDYIDTAVITYSALASLAMIRATRAGASRWPGVWAGMASGAMLHSNVGTAFLVPATLVWIVPFSMDRTAWRRAVWVFGHWCLGGLLLTLLLALFSVTEGGPWLFFVPSFTWLNGMSSNPWDVTGLAWVWGAPWTFMPFALAVGTVVLLVSPGRRAAMTPLQRRALAGFLLTYAIFFLWDNVGPGNALALSYYVSWLYPSAFVLIGAVFLGAAPRPALHYPMVFALAGWLLLSLMVPAFDVEAYRMAGLAICVTLAVLAALMRSATAAAITLVALLTVINFEVPQFRAVPEQASQFRVADRGMQFTDRFTGGTVPRFALSGNDALMPYFRAVASQYLWQFTVVSMNFPVVTPVAATQVRPGTVVILLAARPETGAAFNDAFSPYGLVGVPLGSDRIDTPGGEIFMTAIRAETAEVDAGRADGQGR
jgi:hypothetical protein